MHAHAGGHAHTWARLILYHRVSAGVTRSGRVFLVMEPIVLATRLKSLVSSISRKVSTGAASQPSFCDLTEKITPLLSSFSSTQTTALFACNGARCLVTHSVAVNLCAAAQLSAAATHKARVFVGVHVHHVVGLRCELRRQVKVRSSCSHDKRVHFVRMSFLASCLRPLSPQVAAPRSPSELCLSQRPRAAPPPRPDAPAGRPPSPSSA